MDEYTVYKYIEFLMVSLYLMLVFLSVQIFFMWIDVDKSALRSKISANEPILKNSIITVFFIETLLIFNEFIKGTKPNLIFELFDLMSYIFVVYFVYNWHLTLKACSHKKKPASDFILDACLSGRVKIEPYYPLLGESKRTTSICTSNSGYGLHDAGGLFDLKRTSSQIEAIHKFHFRIHCTN